MPNDEAGVGGGDEQTVVVVHCTSDRVVQLQRSLLHHSDVQNVASVGKHLLHGEASLDPLSRAYLPFDPLSDPRSAIWPPDSA